VEGDHKILRRSLAKAMATMTSLEQGAGLRRDMVHALESFLLLRRVQEHHDAREQRLVYPVLDQQLDQEQVALLCDALGRP
jgi:hemerythrin-like domain-containing protein